MADANMRRYEIQDLSDQELAKKHKQIKKAIALDRQQAALLKFLEDDTHDLKSTVERIRRSRELLDEISEEEVEPSDGEVRITTQGAVKKSKQFVKRGGSDSKRASAREKISSLFKRSMSHDKKSNLAASYKRSASETSEGGRILGEDTPTDMSSRNNSDDETQKLSDEEQHHDLADASQLEFMPTSKMRNSGKRSSKSRRKSKYKEMKKSHKEAAGMVNEQVYENPGYKHSISSQVSREGGEGGLHRGPKRLSWRGKRSRGNSQSSQLGSFCPVYIHHPALYEKSLI